MREFKFRVWHKDSGKMAYDVTPFQQDSKTEVMQYTGLKDNNGKEIYEGDIVHFDTEDGIVTALVVWECDEDEDRHISGFVFKALTCDDYPEDSEDPVLFEVIGNIYENPELSSPK